MVCDWCGGIIYGDKYWTVTGVNGNFCSERCCEECGAKNKKLNRFCEECGAKLGE